MVGTNTKVELKESILRNVEQYIDASVEDAVKLEIAKLDLDAVIKNAVRLELANLNVEAKIQDAVKRELSKMKNYDAQQDDARRRNASSGSTTSPSNPQAGAGIVIEHHEAADGKECERQCSQQELQAVFVENNSQNAGDLLEDIDCRGEIRGQHSQGSQTVTVEHNAVQNASQVTNVQEKSKCQRSQESQTIADQLFSENNTQQDCYSQQSQTQSQLHESQISLYEPSETDYVLSESSQNESQAESVPGKKILPQKQWKKPCQSLLTKMWRNKDSKPFRVKVDEVQHPEYTKIISIPVDLRGIQEDLESDNYKNINDFFADMDRIFANSRKFNPDKKSCIYKQTTRLKRMYDSEKEVILASRKSQTPKKASPAKKSSPKSKVKRKILSSDEENDDDDVKPRAKKLKTRSRIRDAEPSDLEGDDTDSTIDEYEQQSGHRATGRRTRSSTLQTRNKNKKSNLEAYSDTDSESDDDEKSDEEESDSNSSSEESDDENSDSASRTSNEISRGSEAGSLPSVTLTSSEDLNNIKCGDNVSIVARVLSAEEDWIDIPSKDRSETFDLYKFVLTNDDGVQIQCQAWRDMAGKMCRENLRQNRVVTLKRVVARSPYRPEYNGGNMNYVIEIKPFSEVIKEPKKIIVKRG
ncbi:hypothetical protein QAD02_014716 [Eretmocerus hayati]|uniref:Uncharacterized protein n=1 Tax=Eretmocerus hayati TaxID=131215 RepID=A0ACC2P6M9_9HYME|nr:hypothetical protein QAD02_014716 [Eretmocerus hayati]